MSATKKCTNCGAENDLLLTNCLFCKSSLPHVDPNSISNEELILNAGEWIGKVGSKFEHRTENFNEWTGKGKIEISSNQIEGMAQKYLSLLQVRSFNNPHLAQAYGDLKKQMDDKRNSLLYKITGGDKSNFFWILFLIAMLSFVIIMGIFNK